MRNTRIRRAGNHTKFLVQRRHAFVIMLRFKKRRDSFKIIIIIIIIKENGQIQNFKI